MEGAMNKREAKKRVCGVTADLLSAEYHYGAVEALIAKDFGLDELPVPDIHRLRIAVYELMDELKKRGVTNEKRISASEDTERPLQEEQRSC